MPDLSMNWFRAMPQQLMPTPLPPMKRGFWALLMSSAACLRSHSSGCTVYLLVGRAGMGAFSMGTFGLSMSGGSSRKTGPGRPPTALRNAAARYSGMRLVS
ncbi:MAG: hypothetical protein BWX71_02495 [Deltaproteobacteria bacterium ADurb.Bin072]|nr:MAG: hypothetical protein BWX71_02495 [Deltaproteobacteria bacterium ADurb.Bin072]